MAARPFLWGYLDMSQRSPGPISTEVDEQVVTNWRVVLAAGAVAGLALAGLAVLFVVAPGSRPAPEKQAPHARTARVPAAWERLPIPALPAVVEVQTRPAEKVLPPPAPEKKRVAREPARSPELIRPPVLVANAVPPPRPNEPSGRGPTSLRRTGSDEQSLTVGLWGASTEVDLDAVRDASALLLKAAGEAFDAAHAKPKEDAAAKPPGGHPLLGIVPLRKDLAGLPVRSEKECRMDEKAARDMTEPQRALRRAMFGLARKRSIPPDVAREAADLEEYLKKCKIGGQKEAVPWLVQVFQGQETEMRLLLVRLLARIEDRSASAALAGRAVFDLSPEVREAAVEALRSRPAKEYRQVLLDGLRHVWVPAAEHAADALMALGDRDAVPALIGLLDLRDPAAPRVTAKEQVVVAELVRVNHLRNCLLCHAPSFNSKDPMRGLIPVPGEPLREEYYESTRGTFVRADTTFLKQDFSVLHRVEKPNPWPAVQRFDYLVRQRELPPEEAERARMASRNAGASGEEYLYPQKQAVLCALAELTGKDLGLRAADWEPILLKPRLKAGP